MQKRNFCCYTGHAQGHSQVVRGFEWDVDRSQLWSGGEDCKVGTRPHPVQTPVLQCMMLCMACARAPGTCRYIWHATGICRYIWPLYMACSRSLARCGCMLRVLQRAQVAVSPAPHRRSRILCHGALLPPGPTERVLLLLGRAAEHGRAVITSL